jgi:hypothetical protein
VLGTHADRLGVLPAEYGHRTLLLVVGVEVVVGSDQLRPTEAEPRIAGSAPGRTGEVRGMQIAKDAVLDFLRSHGREGDVPDAQRELPDEVDPNRDSGVLDRLGIDGHELLAALPESVRNVIPDELEERLGNFGV